MIHIIPHHIAVGSYARWYDIIQFEGDVKIHLFDDREEIERKLIGEPPYEDRLISHLSSINPQMFDIVVFDYKYLNGLNHLELYTKLQNLSRKFNNCKFLIFDDDNSTTYYDCDRFTIFSNLFDVKYHDDKIMSIPENCNYYRYRAPHQDYFKHLEHIVKIFDLNLRQKKYNFFVGVDKKERLEVFKYIHNTNMVNDGYVAYSGFTTTYDDSEISESLVQFKKEHIPTILDTPFEMSEMGSVNVEIPPLPFTLNSYFSCILETQILLNESIHLSEKSWNPFISRNIPLILGSSFINQYLISIGFWMADDLFDLTPKFTRTDIINQYKSNLDIINNMSYSEIHEYYVKNLNNIDRNFQNMKYAKFTYDSNRYESLKRKSLQ